MPTANETAKLAIANIGLLSIGEDRITSFSASNPIADKLNDLVFEEVVRELLGDDWFFSRKRVALSDLTAVYKLTLDSAPTPAAFEVGATLTGASSAKTCTVLERLSDTVYLVTEPSGDFIDGETIGDGTNSRDCAAGYPDADDELGMGQWDYGYVLPTDQLFIRGIGDIDYDKVKYPYTREGSILLTNTAADNGFLHYNKFVGENGSGTVSDVTGFPTWFRRLISARIAYILAPNVTENARIRQKAELEWKEAQLTAREQNGDEACSEFEEGSRFWSDAAYNELP